jgi:CDP-glucose 4,6-dehydratase
MKALSFYQGKKVFITGHTGFKGTWLCRVLLRAGAELTGYSLAFGEPSLFAQTETARDLHSITGDVRNRDALVQAVREARPDLVFHLAAQPIVRFSYREPALTYETNVMGTVHILEALRLASGVCSFVNVTTDKVYENREWYWGYRENESLCGRDPYANSKSCSELVTYSYQQSFFDCVGSPAISTARAGNVIGGGDYSEDRIIPDCVRAAQEGDAIIVRNPQAIRPYQHVLDCLSGYLLLAEKQYEQQTLAGNYNFGPDEDGCVTTGNLVQMFCDAWGDGASWRARQDNGPHEDIFLKLDCAKAKTVLGWKPRWDIKTAVRQAVEFTRTGIDRERLACVDRQITEYFK